MDSDRFPTVVNANYRFAHGREEAVFTLFALRDVRHVACVPLSLIQQGGALCPKMA